MLSYMGARFQLISRFQNQKQRSAFCFKHFSISSQSIIFMSLQPQNQAIHLRLLTNKHKLIELLARLLEQIVKTTKQMPKGYSQYHSQTPPSISIKDYLDRINKFYQCSSSCYVLVLAYIDDYQEKFENFVVNKYCIHKFLLVAITVAAKFNDDFFFKNSYYAKVGGISTQQLNNLQRSLLMDLDYTVFIKTAKFEEYLSKLGMYDKCKQ